VDLGGGERQEYVEDCVVCCRPIRFTAVYSEEDGEFQVDARED
jgi:Cysteine-rich CPXCG